MLIIPFLCELGGAAAFYTGSLAMILVGASTATCQVTIYAMAAAFSSPKYMAAVMLGYGFAGFGIILLRGIVVLIWPADGGSSNAFDAALALYLLTCILNGICAIATL